MCLWCFRFDSFLASISVELQHTDRHWLCNHRLMGTGSDGIMQSDFTCRAIMPVHIAAVNGGRRVSSRDMTEERRDHSRDRGETIGLGVKCRILDFSQQCCSIYASRWQQPSQTCLCADVGELWEHVFFFFPGQGTGLGCWAELVGVTQISSVMQMPLMM